MKSYNIVYTFMKAYEILCKKLNCIMRCHCYATLRYATLALRYATLRCATLRYATLRYATLRYAALRYATSRYAALRYVALNIELLKNKCLGSRAGVISTLSICLDRSRDQCFT